MKDVCARALMRGPTRARIKTGILITAAAIVTTSALAGPTEDLLKPYVIQLVSTPTQKSGGAGVYLGQGLVLTASHVGGHRVLIGDLNMPARVLKSGSFEKIDLKLLLVDQEKLPVSLRLRRMPLCQAPFHVGAPVVLASPQAMTWSKIASPLLLAPIDRTKYATMITDVETSGKSGSGVFDTAHNCLLGILSATVTNTLTKKMVGTYFVPATTIQSFVPTGTRW